MKRYHNVVNYGGIKPGAVWVIPKPNERFLRDRQGTFNTHNGYVNYAKRFGEKYDLTEAKKSIAEDKDFFTGSKFADEDGNTFSVEQIIAFAKKNPKYFHNDFPLSKIKHDLSWWQGNKERMMNADTSYPLLVIQNDDGRLGVADGLNRMKKAIDVEKKKTIDVYLVPKKDIMQFSKKQVVAESAEQPVLMSAFRDFLPIAMRELDIEQLPPIRLLKQVPAGDQPTFGEFVNKENVVYLGISERHPVDILRTLAHELVHYKQNTEHQLAAGSGATGSPEENQAHEVAGVIMRDFNKLHPEYFKSQAVELTEDRSDYEIRNRAKLDNILVNLCRHVVEGQRVDPDRYGMVAACVVDPDNRQVIGVNELTQDGTRRHGERVAIERYQEQYGDIPEGSIIVTTCSPCNEAHMTERYGESCTDIINNSNCRKVYCGYQDPSQTEAHNEFTMEVTGNADIVDLCKHFAATFLNENFADGRGPGRPGDSVRHGIPKNATMAELEKASHARGRKGQLARWQLNMRRGRKR
jgi:pyrimidine deaminase RibD-like protein